MCNTNEKTDDANRKLKFNGCCNLTNTELAKIYKLDKLSDRELATVGLERSSLLDDYRHLEEMAQLSKLQDRPLSKHIISKLKTPIIKSPRMPSKQFSYDLLNKFFRCMKSQAVNFCRFMEEDLSILPDFQEDNNIILLSAKECGFACYESYFDYLDRMYRNGEQDRVLDFVVKVMTNFNPEPCRGNKPKSTFYN